MPTEVKIRELGIEDRAWASKLLAKEWGSPLVVTKGESHQADQLPGFVAYADGEKVGLATYHIDKKGQSCELITLNSLKEGIGVGKGLVDAIKKVAREKGCKRLWLITTNDNIPALRWYQKRGFHLSALYPNAIEASRKIKHSIPMIGMDAIPVRDEIELEIWL